MRIENLKSDWGRKAATPRPPARVIAVKKLDDATQMAGGLAPPRPGPLSDSDALHFLSRDRVPRCWVESANLGL